MRLSHLLLLCALVATFALTVNADVQCLVNPCEKAARDGLCPREACKPDYSKGCDFKCSACPVTCANVLCIATTTCVHDPVNCRTECVPIDGPKPTTPRVCVQGGPVPAECPNDYHWDAQACKFVCNPKQCTSNEGFPVAVGGRYFDKCNGCTCNADGTGTCTKKGCTDVCYDDLGNGYKAGATRKADCNTCTCQRGENGKGVWMCTLMACEQPPQLCVQGGSIPPECPNDYHWDDKACKFVCNQPNGVQCLVNPCENAARDGLCPIEACTPDYTKGCDFKCSACRITCANVRCAAGTQCVHDPFNCQTRCKPVPTCTSNEGNQVAVGETYFNKCNRCTCGADGVGACTRRACLSTCYDDQGNGYAVGQSRQKGCNTCGCNKDATGKAFWACTERACITPAPAVQCLVNPCDQAVRDGICPKAACTPDYSTGCDFKCTACRRTCANVRCPSGTECVHDDRNCYTECKPTGRVCIQGGPVPPECPNNNHWDSASCKFVCN